MGEQVDAILMASGFSQRFGDTDKLLQPFQRKPLAAHALELMCAIGQISRVHFVYSSAQVGRLAEQYPVNTIHNDKPERGACESIRLGVSASAAGYYLFVPCDQPFLDAATIHKILLCKKEGGIVIPHHAEKPGSPVLFSNAFRDALLQLKDKETGRVVILQNAKAVTSVEIKNAMALLDIDTKEDLISLSGRAGSPSVLPESGLSQQN